MALPFAPATFLHVARYSSKFNRLNSIARCSALGRIADSSGVSRVDAGATFWSAQLGGTADLGSCHLRLFANGLRVLVVALGEPHDFALLAISQRPPHRPRYGREHGITFSL